MINYKITIVLTEGEDTLPSIQKIVEKYGMFKGITKPNLNYHFGQCKKNEVFIGGVKIVKEVVK